MRTAWLCLLSLLVPASLAIAQTTALVGARVFDGTGRVIERATILLKGDRVEAVGPATLPVPEGAMRVDLSGRTILPGLVNAHGHAGTTVGLRADPNGYTRDNLLRQLRTYAAYGVTTVFSLGDDEEPGFVLRNEQRAGGLDRARLFVAGPVIYAETADAARTSTDKVIAMTPDLIKIRVDDNLGTSKKMPEEAWRAVLERAHEKGLRLAAHLFYLADAVALVKAGTDFIAHSVRDRPVDQELARDMRARDACYCPTLTREISTFIYDTTPAWTNDPFFTAHVSADIPQQLADPARHAQIRQSNGWKLGQQYKAGLDVAKKNLKAMSDQGVRIAFGTDSGPPGRFQGFFEHLELEMMVEAGLTPLQALKSATGDAALCHRKAGEIGTLQPGAYADLVVLTANPLDDIKNTRTIESVYIGGKKIRE
ncbi:MAG: amidohydrolase family protein [Vicinamibacterales bacterium]